MSQRLDYLLSPKAVRDRTAELFRLTEKGELSWKLDLSKLDYCAELVTQVIQEKYPSLEIPFHSRWGHFRVGGVDRVQQLDQNLNQLSPLEKLKAKWDLVIVSVLLDAGAGMEWKFREVGTGQTFSKSEGLALASLEMFLAGKFSDQRGAPYQVTAPALRNLTLSRLQEGFQVTASNPMIGLEGRLKLLHGLGNAVEKLGRPGELVNDILRPGALPGVISAVDVLRVVLSRLSSIWPGRVEYEGQNLGDTWIHPSLGSPGSFESLVPFHKLSQWLTYSLLEPLMEYGAQITDLDQMTGLPEYRNGGLFLDAGVLELRDQSRMSHAFQVSDLEIIEWRALTVQLLDRVAPKIRGRLGKSPEEWPLVKILEGGTWWAGRKLAVQKRSDGGPPLKIVSDGTVF